ncbi:hypothetical protein HHI36_010956, partial [Cryptolaemus montrouzieri]
VGRVTSLRSRKHKHERRDLKRRKSRKLLRYELSNADMTPREQRVARNIWREKHRN